MNDFSSSLASQCVPGFYPRNSHKGHNCGKAHRIKADRLSESGLSHKEILRQAVDYTEDQPDIDGFTFRSVRAHPSFPANASCEIWFHKKILSEKVNMGKYTTSRPASEYALYIK